VLYRYSLTDFGDNLSPKTATVAELSPFSATVAEFGDSRRFLRQSPFSVTVWTGLYANNKPKAMSIVHTVTENGDCRRKRRLSPFTVTVAVLGDKLSPKSATCG